MGNTNNREDGSLKRTLTPMHVWAIAFGCVIGWGSFINPGKKFLSNSGVAGTAIAMILGMLPYICIWLAARDLIAVAPDWTKATKVTFTPDPDGNTGVVVINVATVKAGYICAVEIDCE